MRFIRKWLVIRKEDLNDLEVILDLSEDAGIFMHHDSITGTAKRYVDDDYMRRITDIEEKVRQLLKNNFQKELYFVNEY